ncbi:MAG: hypothetical protein COV75_09095 [Candidatus Omnitrophica bacterium CG11_big_fil_rev_8_21_14_0_20_63_9]|nr:MAG: hypothetical protein COV75_09095 [Candidatus Omnitrophica bacterium CG11_big_fil_rev_8_21_14_0_20_63_9]
MRSHHHHTWLRSTALGLALLLGAGGCYGPFNLTRRLYHWNGAVGGKWEQEFMFLLLVWAPVYAFTGLADSILFNSLEFWTGENPVEPPRSRSGRPGAPAMRRIVRGEDEAYLTYTTGADGPRLFIEQFRHGEPSGTLLLEYRDGSAVGLDAEGRVLLTARPQPRLQE